MVPGLPAVDEFPIDIWERLRSQMLAQKGAHLLRHASSRGDADLRKAVAWLRSEADFAKVVRVCTDIGIKPSSLSFYCIEAKLKPAFVFGFGAWTPTQIRESLLRLASALR